LAGSVYFLIDYTPLPEQKQVTALIQQYTVPQRVQQHQQQHHEHATIPLPSGAQPRGLPPQQSTEKGLGFSYPSSSNSNSAPAQLSLEPMNTSPVSGAHDSMSTPLDEPATAQHAAESIGTKPATCSTFGGPIVTEPHYPVNALPGPSLNQSKTSGFPNVSVVAPLAEPSDDSQTSPGHGQGRDHHSMQSSQVVLPSPPPQVHSIGPTGVRRPHTFDGYSYNHRMGRRSGVDWMVPAVEPDAVKVMSQKFVVCLFFQEKKFL